MRIVIIGTGNTATVLGKLFHKGGHRVIQVMGRDESHAAQLAKTLNSPYSVDQKQVNIDADLYVIAVADSAIPEIATWLRVDKKPVVHTAGSVEIEILIPCSKNHGVLYPLQSLRKEMDYLPEIPFLVDGNTEDSGTLIYDFATSISQDVEFANDQKRLMVHIAAVITSNFTNHLYTVAEDFCKKQKTDFKMLLPLIKETAARLQKFSPLEMQTGPAIRNDTETIKRHLSILEAYPLQQSIYRYFTDSIQTSKTSNS
jgi:predicted short-subunit dehydrogenase-like oxidoreductase (DUF2520 family)